MFPSQSKPQCQYGLCCYQELSWKRSRPQRWVSLIQQTRPKARSIAACSSSVRAVVMWHCTAPVLHLMLRPSVGAFVPDHDQVLGGRVEVRDGKRNLFSTSQSHSPSKSPNSVTTLNMRSQKGSYRFFHAWYKGVQSPDGRVTCGLQEASWDGCEILWYKLVSFNKELGGISFRWTGKSTWVKVIVT